MSMSFKKAVLCLCAVLVWSGVFAQNREDIQEQADGYVWPTDSTVFKKLHQWQDLKFGVLMHWGISIKQATPEIQAVSGVFVI